MKTRTSLALILAGAIGIGASLKIKSDLSSVYEEQTKNIPTEVLKAGKELDEMRGRLTTPYQVLENVFESKESEIRFKDLYQKAREYKTNPQIQSANKIEDYILLDSGLLSGSAVIAGIGALSLGRKIWRKVSEMDEYKNELLGLPDEIEHAAELLENKFRGKK